MVAAQSMAFDEGDHVVLQTRKIVRGHGEALID
jgi:hypothetical protein